MVNKPQFFPLYHEDLKTIEDEGQHAIMLAKAVFENGEFISDALLSIFVDRLIMDEGFYNRYSALDRLADIITQAKAA